MKSLKELVGRLKLLADIDMAMVDLLEEQQNRIQKLEEQNKRQQGLIDGHAKKLFDIQNVMGEWKKSS